MRRSHKGIFPNPIVYSFARIVSCFLNRFKLNNHFIRNELKKVKGSAVVLCNHTSSYDHVLDTCATRRHMNFVVADSTYYSKLYCLLKTVRPISKQQFFSKPYEFLQMREVIAAGGMVLMYPAGLCTSDGVSTTLPAATGFFIKFLNADVYVIMSHGMYLSNPKWSKVFRKGKVVTECRKLLCKEQIAALSEDDIFQIINQAMQYDDYEWQKKNLVRFRNADDSRGLENVLYSCPHCKTHFSIENADKFLVCKNCGKTYRLDEYGFFRKETETSPDTPAVWHRRLLDDLRQETQNANFKAYADVRIHQLNKEKHVFEDAGSGEVIITREKIRAFDDSRSMFYEEETDRFFSLPMIPGEYFDLQDGSTVYRCYPKEPKNVAYLTDVIIAFYENRMQQHKGSRH